MNSNPVAKNTQSTAIVNAKIENNPRQIDNAKLESALSSLLRVLRDDPTLTVKITTKA